MSKNLNTKTVVKKVIKEDVILSSDGDNESVSSDESNVIVTKKKIIKNNESGESCGVLLDNNQKSGSKNKVTKVKKDIVNSESEESESEKSEESEDDNNNNNIGLDNLTHKSQRIKKNEKFVKYRENVFNKIKEIIKYNDGDEKYFTSTNLNKEETRNKIIELFADIKVFFHCTLWNRISLDASNCHYIIVKNVFRDFGFSIVIKKNYTKDGDKRVLWYKYYVVKK